LRSGSGLSLSEGGSLPSPGKDTGKTVESSNGLLKAGFRSQDSGFRGLDPQFTRNQESLAWEHIKKQDLLFSMNYRRNVQAWPSLLF
jgi:hypothetical protein